MARYKSDMNKVVGVYESGTYGSIKDSGSTFWPGQVTSHSIDDAENKLINYYLGTASRSYGSLENGPLDATGTLSYNLQDMRTVFWAIGSVNEVAGTGSSVHFVKEIDTNVWQSPFTSGTGQLSAPISFTIEDSKQAPGTGANFIRTVRGAVPNVTTITASQGEKVKVDIDYIGQQLIYSSGTTSTVTEPSYRPYLWSDCSLTVNGSSLDTAKEVSLAINQNMEAPHYLNGSREISVPFPGNREYTLGVTLDLESNEAKMLYDEFFKAGSTFNAVFDLNADNTTTGSQHTVFTMSGCFINTMDNPSASEGINESIVEIRPKNVTGSCWDMGSAYNPF